MSNQNQNDKIYKVRNTLSKAPKHEELILLSVKEENPIVNRLMEMGLIQDEIVKILQEAPLGDPIEIEVMGYKLCVRKKEVSYFEVEYANHND
ncbi:MAG: ferrous iron transport protein A [Leptospiraceae bacterium]|nr:ferrous iron transport protein A [Leptospiraceae bacterium]MDW7975058.1 FeoA family protein [Leptospiraceae bacterium]